MKRWMFWIVVSIVFALGDRSMAQERQPKPIPVDRAQAKRALEALKDRQPRLPLAPPTEEEKQSWGVQAIVTNGLARRRYLPETWFAADFGQDPLMLLEYPLKTKCFWVVSRANNCQYCLGHQEHKLTAIGMTDAQLAGLDAGGPDEDGRTRACLEAARRITLEPHLWSGSDLELLREQMTDEQIIEMVYTISMFNSVNRWTDSSPRIFRKTACHPGSSGGCRRTAASFPLGSRLPVANQGGESDCRSPSGPVESWVGRSKVTGSGR
jgi:AhpD family alkylhydroperoxidase